VNELREALAIEPEAKSVDPDNLLDTDIILSVCAGLVVIDEAMSVVRLIHYTTQEYMYTIQPRCFPQAKTEIASRIFTYLASPDFSNLPASLDDEVKPYTLASLTEFANLPVPVDKQAELVLKHPLLGYSQHCLLYAEQSELPLQKEIESFLATAHSWQRFWYSYHLNFKHRSYLMYYWGYPGWRSSATPLCISAAANMLITTRHLLTMGEFERKDGFNALCVAAYYGHLEMVQLLVENGVDINHNDQGRFEEALQAAAEMGHESVVQFLIQLGANVNAQEPEFGTAVHPRSCWLMKLDSLCPIFLMDKGVGDVTQVLYGTALHAASYCGHESVVRLLIEMGADTNIYGGHFGTALIAASHEGHQPVVQLLLENGANINALGEVYGSALHAAVIKNHRSLALLLIKKGADVNAHGGYYETVLQAAIHESNYSMLEFLIKMGADINGQSEFYGTALQLASRIGSKSLAQLLIENSADVNAPGGIQGTALQLASFFPFLDTSR
jgi:ankyrin repeat protein